MHYYQKNIGDYAKKTGHLTALEHGVYNLIMDGYYDRERGPTKIEAERWARARTLEEKAAVSAILEEFFVLVGEEYTHQHIIEEIESYKMKAVIAQENGKKGGRPPKKTQQEPANNPMVSQPYPTDNPEITGSKANQEPITINQEPSNSPIPPAGAVFEIVKKPRAAFSLKTYLTECKAEGVKPIPDGDAVFAYAAEAGISTEVLALHWSEFKARYTIEGAKKYKAWRLAFGKSVRGNWFKLWYFDNNGNCTLTTAGVQAKNAAEAAKRRAA